MAERRRGRRAGGFTLVELMLVVALAAIVVAIAVPAYQGHSTRARRADAHASLLDAANRQLRFFADNGAYTDDMTALGYAADPAPSRDGHYLLSAALTAGGYTLSAAPVGAQAGDAECGTLSYDSRGSRGASGGGGECWD